VGLKGMLRVVGRGLGGGGGGEGGECVRAWGGGGGAKYQLLVSLKEAH
jgi:hypothetical protein